MELVGGCGWLGDAVGWDAVGWGFEGRTLRVEGSGVQASGQRISGFGKGLGTELRVEGLGFEV